MENLYDKFQNLHEETHLGIAENLSASRGDGGKIRATRGDLVETIVKELWKELSNSNSFKKEKFTIISSCGQYKIKKGLDIHLYKNEVLVGMVECKTYLDEPMLQRAISDAEELINYNVPKVVVALENAMDDETFCYWLSKNKLNNIFILVNGKRSSGKPLYDKNYFKNLNKSSFNDLYNWMLGL